MTVEEKIRALALAMLEIAYGQPAEIIIGAAGVLIDAVIRAYPEHQQASVRQVVANTILIRERIEQALATEH